MDYNPGELNSVDETKQPENRAAAPERKPLYVYQRIRKEGPGYSHRGQTNKSKPKKEHSSHTSFSLPKIERKQYGKFTLSAIAVLIMFIVFIALGRVCSNLLYIFCEKLLYLLRLDSLPFDEFTFDNLRVLTTYILSFALGGFVVYLLLRILSVFSQNGIIYQAGHVLRLILVFLIIIFAVITVIKLLAGHSVYSIRVLGTMAPLCLYTCSCLICIFSKINFLDN